MPYRCPVCGANEFSRGAATFLGESVNPAQPRTAVMPFLCKNCSAITLYLSPDQPENPVAH
jgi:hypothetical protein